MTRNCLVAFIVLALGGCAGAEPEWQEVSPRAARFAVAEALPAHRVMVVRQGRLANGQQEIEQFLFDHGDVAVDSVAPGRKLSEAALAEFGSLASTEAAARRRQPRLREVVASERVVHERLRGDGWLVAFSTDMPGVNCTSGRAYYAMNTVGDDAGFTFDTVMAAFVCHPVRAVSPEMRGLFRTLRLRGG